MSSRDLAQSSCRQDFHDTAFPHKVKQNIRQNTFSPKKFSPPARCAPPPHYPHLPHEIKIPPGVRGAYGQRSEGATPPIFRQAPLFPADELLPVARPDPYPNPPPPPRQAQNHISQKKSPLSTHDPRPPQGWLSKSEAQALIAVSAPNAPQNYKFRNIRSGRARQHIRTMVRGHRLYISEADLLREIEQHPFITSAAPASASTAPAKPNPPETGPPAGKKPGNPSHHKNNPPPPPAKPPPTSAPSKPPPSGPASHAPAS